MELKGTLTERDLRTATWLHLAPRKAIGALGLLVLAFGIWVLWLAFFSSKPDPGWGKWIMLAVLAYLSAYFFIYVPFWVKRHFRQYKELQREQVLTPEESGLSAKTVNGKSMLVWSDLRSWKENKNVFMLYVTDDLYHLVPKHFFASETDIKSFREMLQRSAKRS